MSYDLAVWHSDTAMSPDDAGTFYSHVGHDWVIVREHPALRDFCRALMAEFPGVIDPADLEQDFTAPGMTMLMPYPDLLKSSKSAAFPAAPKPLAPSWSILPSFTGLAMTLSLGSGKPEIGPAIPRLAGVYGLIAYDPQAGAVALPPHLADQPCLPLPEPVLMVIEEQPEALRVRISFEDRVLIDGIVPTRQEAHRLAREQTIALNRLAYEIEDKRLITSSMSWSSAPAQPGNSYVFELLKRMPRAPRLPEGKS